MSELADSSHDLSEYKNTAKSKKSADTPAERVKQGRCVDCGQPLSVAGRGEDGRCRECEQDRSLDEQSTAADPRVAKVLNVLRLLTTTRVTPQDLPNFKMYFHSPSRLVVSEYDSLMPEAWFKNNGPNLKSTGFATVQELHDFLLSLGVRSTKKPKASKPSYSQYD
jgi:hypothetical protein